MSPRRLVIWAFTICDPSVICLDAEVRVRAPSRAIALSSVIGSCAAVRIGVEEIIREAGSNGLGLDAEELGAGAGRVFRSSLLLTGDRNHSAGSGSAAFDDFPADLYQLARSDVRV